VLLVLDWKVDAETLEVNDDDKDEYGREEIGAIREIRAVERFLERTHLVLACHQKVEQCNDGSFKFGSAAGVDGRRAESFPDNVLADVRGDEKGNSRAKTVVLLEKLVQNDDDDTCKEELDDDEDCIPRSEVLDVTVHARDNVRDRFTDGDQDPEQLLCTAEQGAVFLETLVNLDDLGTSKELHDQP